MKVKLQNRFWALEDVPEEEEEGEALQDQEEKQEEEDREEEEEEQQQEEPQEVQGGLDAEELQEEPKRRYIGLSPQQLLKAFIRTMKARALKRKQKRLLKAKRTCTAMLLFGGGGKPEAIDLEESDLEGELAVLMEEEGIFEPQEDQGEDLEEEQGEEQQQEQQQDQQQEELQEALEEEALEDLSLQLAQGPAQQQDVLEVSSEEEGEAFQAPKNRSRRT